MIKAKDEAEARARASLIYIAVLAKLGGFLVFLFWRAFMLPRYVAFLLASAIGAYAARGWRSVEGSVPRGVGADGGHSRALIRRAVASAPHDALAAQLIRDRSSASRGRHASIGSWPSNRLLL